LILLQQIVSTPIVISIQLGYLRTNLRVRNDWHIQQSPSYWPVF